MKLEDIIEKFTLLNILKYENPSVKSIMGPIMGMNPEYKSQAQQIKSLIETAITKFKETPKEEIKLLIKKKYPDLLIKKEKIKESYNLPKLRNAKMGKVILRLPPEPSGYLHIGHAYSFYINHMYKEQYEGELILRFEDTNPKKVKLDYYDSIKDTLKYLDIKYDKIIFESDHLEQYYQLALQLIEQEQAFVCTEDTNTTRLKRAKKLPSTCRNYSIKKNLTLWERMITDMKEGEAVLRLKGDYQHEDPALRDPTIMRIVNYPHPRIGTKFRVFPLYDFAVAIEDGSITHVLRSEEFTLKTPLQKLIRSYLKIPHPEYLHFSRLRLKNTPVAKRDVRELIENGIVKDWNDPRLSTVFGLRSRGIAPETIKEIVNELRLSTAQGIMDWSIILTKNRKLLDNQTLRLSAVLNPHKLIIEGMNSQIITLKNHPSNKALGTREIKVRSDIWISNSDVKDLRIGKLARLIEFCNIKIQKISSKFINAKIISEKTHNIPHKLQWVSNESAQKFTLRSIQEIYLSIENKTLNPRSLAETGGYIESDVLNKKIFDVVHLGRYGLACIDSLEEGHIILNQTESFLEK